MNLPLTGGSDAHQVDRVLPMFKIYTGFHGRSEDSASEAYGLFESTLSGNKSLFGKSLESGCLIEFSGSFLGDGIPI